jgi:cytochrome c oxidase subunit II
MFIAIALIIIVAGSVLFRLVNAWWLTPPASHWKTMVDTPTITFVITGLLRRGRGPARRT